jgi:hypothetical protein
MGKRLHVALFIIGIAIAIAIAVLPFILEARGMKVPLGVWYFLEILAVLMIVGTLLWAYWEKIKVMYLALRTKLRDLSHQSYILLSKRLRIVHKDVSIRFNVNALTLADLNAKIESLQSQIDKLKEDKNNKHK